MPEQNQPGSATQSHKKSQPKAKLAPVAEQTSAEIERAPLPAEPIGAEAADGRSSLTPLLWGPKGAFGGGSMENQVARLGDARLLTVQRQALAAEIGRVQGNRHLQRAMALLKGNQKKVQNRQQDRGYQREANNVDQSVQRFEPEALTNSRNMQLSVQAYSPKPQIQRHGDHNALGRARDKYLHTLEHAGTNQATWEAGLVSNATFLGISITSGIHQELVDRLNIAETYLRNQHPGVSDAQIATQIGLYSISGRRPPGTAVSGSRISNHAFGIAIDVNYRGNPYIARSRTVDEIIARATELVLGTAIHVRASPGRRTLEQLRASYERASNALQAYFRLRGNRSELISRLRARGLPTDSNSVDRRMQQIEADYNNRTLRREFATTDPSNPRDPAAGFIDLTQELVEALGNRAGLYWGGQYPGGKDLMHFDWRRGTIRRNHRV